ncbi:MAG: hypothetical protein E7056_07160 [Lentisphaerae bacterium]|nr:hypothetical protein [Lentisphaerota bacterium]
MDKFTYQDISFSWQQNVLIAKNSRLYRKIDFAQGMPQTLELVIDKTAIAGENSAFDFHLAGFPAPGTERFLTDYQLKDVQFAPLCLPDGNGAEIRVKVFESIRELQLEFCYILYCDMPWMAVETKVASAVTPLLYWNPRQSHDTFRCFDEAMGVNTICDSLKLTDFTKIKSVEFQMRTDYFDEPVLEHEYCEGKDLYGNILIAEKPEHKQFFFLQEAPPSAERRGNEPGDFLIQDNVVSSLGSGITPADVTPDRQLKTNRTVCGLAADGNAAKLIKEYLRCRQQGNTAVAGQITVNPWGCGKFPSLLNEKFLGEEIVATGDIGADVYQIDDGYEHGLLQDLSLHNRKLDKNFWQTSDALLPNGFTPLQQLAAENDVKLSLWFAASCNRDYVDWRESADILLNRFRDEKFESFKLDAVIFNSYTAEENFGKLLNALYNESNGKITVNLDVTNGTRGGLYKFAEYGLLFLENRYCCHNWVTHPYHPENTLDNLWNLAKYTRIQNLQIEVPNPGDILEECYQSRQMTLPSEYDFEYWLMIPFFASPLLWMTPSLVSAENTATIKKMLQIYRQYRQEWRNSIITPVGNRPNGSEITGFYADSGYLLLFREKSAPESVQLQLPEFESAEVIYSNAATVLSKDGTVTISTPGGAALIKLNNR